MRVYLTTKQKFIINNSNSNSASDIARKHNNYLPHHLAKDLKILVNKEYLTVSNTRIKLYNSTKLGRIQV
jgi:hypothetical protein